MRRFGYCRDCPARTGSDEVNSLLEFLIAGALAFVVVAIACALLVFVRLFVAAWNGFNDE